MGPSALLTAALATLTTATSLTPRAPAAPRLFSVDFSGNACPDATVAGSTSRLSFTFPGFAAQLGGSDVRAKVRNCQALLTVDEGVPGFALAVRRVSGSGSFFGSPGAELKVVSTAFWQDFADVLVERNQTYTPPADRPSLQPIAFDFSYEDPSAPLVSRCVGDDRQVGTVLVNLRASLRDAGGEGAVAAFLGTEESPVSEQVEFAWVACGEPPVEFETPGEGGEVEE